MIPRPLAASGRKGEFSQPRARHLVQLHISYRDRLVYLGLKPAGAKCVQEQYEVSFADLILLIETSEFHISSVHACNVI